MLCPRKMLASCRTVVYNKDKTEALSTADVRNNYDIRRTNDKKTTSWILVVFCYPV